jgi:hypothetical protein
MYIYIYSYIYVYLYIYTEISFSTIIALKNGCPSLNSLEITDGLIGFDVDAFVALKVDIL